MARSEQYIRSMNAKSYTVRIVTIVDRPALRGPTYTPVAAGTKVVEERVCSFGAAVRVYEAALRGDYDFASEFVLKVEVIQKRTNASPRVVRKLVERRAVELSREGSIVNDPDLKITALAVAAHRRGNRIVRIASWHQLAA